MSKEQLQKFAEKDLGIGVPYVRGEMVDVKGCWHFSTDGNAIDVVFRDDDDYVAGMNRIFVLSKRFTVLILAFCLMDNHVHFILYGGLNECNKFMHEYVRLTSMHISHKYKEYHSLEKVPVHYQVIGNQDYLKNAIAYVIKNPIAAGLDYLHVDYPWSSGALYFRKIGKWTLGTNQDSHFNINMLCVRGKRAILRTRKYKIGNAELIGELVYPGEYVETELVERIFRTHKSFNYFLSANQAVEIERRHGVISRLSLSDQEMRQHKLELCMELFGVKTIRTLSTENRIRLAKALKLRYNSSPKQIARICKLVYKEMEGLL